MSARKSFSAGEKSIIHNVYEFCVSEKKRCGPVIPFDQAQYRAAEMTGVSISTIRNVDIEANCNKENNEPKFKSPKPIKRKCPVTHLDDFDIGVVRKTILDFYSNRELPTVAKLHEKIQSSINFNGSLSSLGKILKNIGFKFAKSNGRKFLLEKDHIKTARARFLFEMKKLREEGRGDNIIYLDETWVNQNYVKSKCWMDTTSEMATGLYVPPGKGGRFIVVHAGSNHGFVAGAKLTFLAKNDGDYHNQMNHKRFTEWFEEQLLPNIPPFSTIVMDNAPYHSVLINKAPTTASKKNDIMIWLRTHGVSFDEKFPKAILIDLVKRNSPPKKYAIDDLAERHGHRVIRLPPYHCEYNPIELIWAQVKNNIAARNLKFTMKDLKELLDSAIDSVTPENWNKAVRHAEDKQIADSDQMQCIDHFFESFVIELSSSDEDSE